MTKFNPSELADEYRKERKAQRNREYQCENYKLNNKKILQRQKQKRDSKKVVLSDEAKKKRDAARCAKRREYNRKYYLQHRKVKEKPSEEEQENMDAKRMSDRREYKHNWYLKNRERILQKQKAKRAEARRNKSTQQGSNEEICILEHQSHKRIRRDHVQHCQLHSFPEPHPLAQHHFVLASYPWWPPIGPRRFVPPHGPPAPTPSAPPLCCLRLVANGEQGQVRAGAIHHHVSVTNSDTQPAQHSLRPLHTPRVLLQ